MNSNLDTTTSFAHIPRSSFMLDIFYGTKNLHNFSFMLCSSLTSLIITFPLEGDDDVIGAGRRWNVIQCAFTLMWLKYMFIALNGKTKAFLRKSCLSTCNLKSFEYKFCVENLKVTWLIKSKLAFWGVEGGG